MNAIIKTKESKPLPQLVKRSSSYKLIVPVKVEEKIRYLLRKFPHTEWSGVLFYTHQGSFENNDLVITCEDIYPMDLGNATYTEFSMSEDVAAYMAENIELFDCDTALCHSHHTMSSQFSGTDMQTLQAEGNDTNCFVSLIVNTAGSYSAKITRKVQTKSEITIKKLGTSYEFFGEGVKEITHDDTETTKTVDKEIIEYFDLEVKRQEVPNTLEYLDTRFEEIERKKLRNKENARVYSENNHIQDYQQREENNDKGFFELLHQNSSESRTYKKMSLFHKDNEELKKIDFEWQPNPKKIHSAVVHILTCNLILNPDKIDLKQWVMKHMNNVYKKIFGERSIYECENNTCGAFSEWKDFIIQHTIDYFDYNDVPDDFMDKDFNLIQSRVAQAILDEISQFLNANSYIGAYYDAISCYIIE